MLDVKRLLRDAVVEVNWDSRFEDFCVLIPKDLFNNIVDNLVKNEEEDDG